MSDEIIVEGKRFVEASAAAKEFDRTRGYLMALCRAGKVEGRRVGRVWYIQHASLVAFVAEQDKDREEHYRKIAEDRAQEYRRLSNTTDSAQKKSVVPLPSPSVPPRLKFAQPLAVVGLTLILLVLATSNAPQIAGLRSRALSAIASLAVPQNGPTTPSQAQAATSTTVNNVFNTYNNTYNTTNNKTYNTTTAAPAQDSSQWASQAYVNQQLNDLSTSLLTNVNRIGGLPSSGGFGNDIALSQNIDFLADANLSDPTLTGGSISGASISGTDLSVSGDTSLGDASTNDLTVNGSLSANNFTIATTTTTSFSSTYSTTTYATSTYGYISNLTADSASTTNATSTNLYSTFANFGSLTVSGTTSQAGLATFLDGFVSQASSTVGDGTQAGGLSIFGGATTTGTLVVQGLSTSTFAGSINLTSGCFSVNGTCVTGTGGSGTVNSGTQGQFAFYNAAGTTLSGTSTLFASTAGDIGIGTSSPFSLLSVGGSAYISGNLTATGTLTQTGLATFANGFFSNASSTVGNGNQNGGLTINGGATTTGNAYVTGYTGLGVAPDGSTRLKVSGGSGSPSVGLSGSTLMLCSSTTACAGFGFEASSPYGMWIQTNSTNYPLVLNPSGLAANGGGVAIGSQTAGTAALAVMNGSVGIGTTTPGSLLSVQGVANFNTATSTFYSSGGINLTAGCFSVNGTCVTGGVGGGSGTVNSGTQGQFAFYNAGGTTLSGTSTLFISSAGNIGVGTTSPSSLFSVAGNLTAENIEGVRFADMYGNMSTNGIAGAISNCSATSTGCIVVVPGNYPTTESVPGVNGAAATTANNISVLDQRTGIDWTAINPQGQNPSSNYRAWQDWTTNFYTAPTAIGTNMVTLKINENAIDGGTNLDSNGYVNKTNWLPLNVDLNSYTPGQHVPLSLTANSYSIGDTLGLAITNYCYGGYSAGGDEGCESMNRQTYQGNVAYGGTLSGSPTTGASSVTVSPSQGSGTQGAGRFLIDLAAANTISAGTISAVSTATNTPVTVTGSGTSWPVSTVSATLGSTITPGTNTVTPSSFTIGAIGNITTSTLVCIADHGNFETLYPTSVNTGAGTFTAVFRKPHSSDALVTAGGLCGYVLDLTADDVTNSLPGNRVQSIIGTLRFAWPVISSPTSDSAIVWISTSDLYSGYNGQWANVAGKNGYVLYPSAEVTSVQTGGGVSNTLSLAPNNVAWTSGDSVEELLYPAVHMLEGNDILEKYYNNPGNAAGVGSSVTLNGIWSGTDRLLSYVNNTASSTYTAQGGTLTAPTLMVAQGEWNYGFSFQQPTDSGLFSVSCPPQGCTGTAYLFQMNNALGYDVMNYDEANQQFTLSAGNRTENYLFGTSTFSVPASESVTGTLTVSTTTATSTFAGNLSIGGSFNVSGATSTFANGINITTGCFSVGGTCVSGLGAGTSYWTLNGSNNIYNNNTGTKVGINNNSPSYTLDVGGFINTDQYSGYKQNGNTVLYASTTNNTLAVGAPNAAAWMAATSTNFNSIAIGPNALQTTPTSGAATFNIAFGSFALEHNTTGTQNMAIGYGTLTQNTGGSQNAAIGYQALSSNTTGGNNMAIGATSLFANTTGANNAAIGFRALANNTTGGADIAIGSSALDQNKSPTSTVAIGYHASYGNGAYYNQGGVTIGYNAGSNFLTGSDYNTLIGYQSGYDISSGNNNLILGTEQTTGSGVTTGSNNILLGNGVSAGLNQGGNNQLNIGNLVFGTNVGTNSTYSSGLIGIGTSTPYSRLEVWGPDTASTTAFTVVNSASTTEFSIYDTGNAVLAGGLVQNSDIRLKTNIQTLDASTALSAIDALDPVAFNWVDPDKGTVQQFGFIAQQVLPIFPNLVSTTSPTALTPDGTLSLNYIDFISPIVAAIQAIDQQLTSLANTVAGFADSFTTKELTFTRGTGNEIDVTTAKVQTLCIGSTCVTEDQLKALLASAGTAPANVTDGSADPTSSDSSTTPDGTSPVIIINGNNPATVAVGSTYNDLGATITGPQEDLNLGISTFVNGMAMSPIVIDTSEPATDTIDYVVTDAAGDSRRRRARSSCKHRR